MDSKPVIYVSRVTNLSDARYCAGMGVQMIGVVVDPAHPDYVSPQKYQEMIGWISGPQRVAEILSIGQVNTDEIIRQYAIDFLHVPLAALSQIRSIDIPLLVEVSWEEYKKGVPQLYGNELNVGYLIVRGVPAEVSLKFPAAPTVLVSLKDIPASYMRVLEASGASGLLLQGSKELAPGLKDYDHLSAALEQMESNDLIP